MLASFIYNIPPTVFEIRLANSHPDTYSKAQNIDAPKDKLQHILENTEKFLKKVSWVKEGLACNAIINTRYYGPQQAENSFHGRRMFFKLN